MAEWVDNLPEGWEQPRDDYVHLNVGKNAPGNMPHQKDGPACGWEPYDTVLVVDWSGAERVTCPECLLVIEQRYRRVSVLMGILCFIMIVVSSLVVFYIRG